MNNKGWTTKNEIDFLNSLGKGQFSISIKVNNTPRRILLKKYIEANKKRVYWGSVKKKEVLDHAQKLLHYVNGGMEKRGNIWKGAY